MAVIVRVGLGYDLHRVAPDRPLMLAGVKIPSPFGLDGHSDADVVIHAIIDAMLGAAGLDDIGQQFPDTDQAYKNIDSTTLLARTRELIADRGYAVANIDATIIAEQPKLKKHKPNMRQRIAQLLDLPQDAVAIKAKTNEGLGELGNSIAIACHAVVALADKEREW